MALDRHGKAPQYSDAVPGRAWGGGAGLASHGEGVERRGAVDSQLDELNLDGRSHFESVNQKPMTSNAGLKSPRDYSTNDYHNRFDPCIHIGVIHL